MKKILLAGLLVGIALAVIGAEPGKVMKATTEDGRPVILLPDGKWQFDKVSSTSAQPFPVQPSSQPRARQAAGPEVIKLFFDAVKAGNLSKVQELNANHLGLINARYKSSKSTEEYLQKFTPLHCAAMEGNKQVAEFLLASGAEVNAKQETYGLTPLHYAAGSGVKEVAELLIARGAEVNAKDNFYGWTPLHNAANGGYKEVVELLLSRGAEVNSKDRWGTTPLRLAANANYNEVVELLKQHGGTE